MKRLTLMHTNPQKTFITNTSRLIKRDLVLMILRNRVTMRIKIINFPTKISKAK